MLNKLEEELLKDVINKSLEFIKTEISTKIKDQFYMIKEYLIFLLTKNKEFNLISRKLTTEQVIIDHIYDCLVGFKFFTQYKSICDIGTGGGLPGILLGIVFNDKSISLIEKSHKKVNFLKECIEKLEIKNVKIIEDLVENINIKQEVITCRAFKSITEIIDLTKDFFYSGGIYILYKGRLINIIEELKNSLKKYNFKYNIHKLEDVIQKERHIVIVRNS